MRPPIKIVSLIDPPISCPMNGSQTRRDVRPGVLTLRKAVSTLKSPDRDENGGV